MTTIVATISATNPKRVRSRIISMQNISRAFPPGYLNIVPLALEDRSPPGVFTQHRERLNSLGCRQKTLTSGNARSTSGIHFFYLLTVVEQFADPERFASKVEDRNDGNTITGNGVINAKRKSFAKRSMESIFNFMDSPKVS